jgi:hypothetical protein
MDFTILFEDQAEIDADELERASPNVIIDEAYRSLGRDSRLGLARGPATTIRDGDAVYHHIPFRCVLHPHPECRFDWARLTMDLSEPTATTIVDMAPIEVQGETPVEIETTTGIVRTLNAKVVPVTGELSATKKQKQSVYFPRILTSGIGFSSGYWDFLAHGDEFLHANRDLHLLLRADTPGPIEARIVVRARLHHQGSRRLIPLLARRTTITKRFHLV